jgi:hypothetical protein
MHIMKFKNIKPVKDKIRTMTIAAIILIAGCTYSIAQSLSASVTLTPAPNQMTSGVCAVTLPDSTGISRIEVVLRDRILDSAWFSHEFFFDQVTGLPSGLSWQRTGTQVTLGLGLLPRQPLPSRSRFGEARRAGMAGCGSKMPPATGAIRWNLFSNKRG